ncbi:MAG: penicillin acylase family protein [Thermoanaerobaculales bacterium]|nr:penicillin acylase family protein [Thermoanaerobaculales bacterium]
MRASKLVISILVLTVAVSGTIQAQDPVTTTRDDRGVWFISGGSLYDVFEAQGYAAATDRLFQMDLFRRASRGTLSELLGAELLGLDFLSTDITVRLVFYSDDEYTQMFNNLSEDAQTAVQAYVNGVNRRILEIYGNFYLMPFEYWGASIVTYLQLSLGYNVLPEPFEVNDVLGILTLLQRQNDPNGEAPRGQINNAILGGTLAAVHGLEGQAMFQDLRWFNDPSAQTMIPASGKKALVAEPQLPTIDVDDFPDLRGAAEEIRTRFETRQHVLKTIGASLKLGSYAWAISGDKTATGNPMIYSGPQLDFDFPSKVMEGSILGGGLEVSGMAMAGAPGIIIGRTPHHAWSIQVGMANTLDWFLESPLSVSLHRMETIHPAGGEPFTFPVVRSPHGPIVSPFPYDPTNPPPEGTPIVAFAYGNWGHEVDMMDVLLKFATAESVAEFDEAVEMAGASVHFTYADRDGNIGYWMAGWEPIRAAGVDPRLPMYGDGNHEWTGERRPRAHATNPAQGYFGGWNNKASIDYNNPYNALWHYNGTAHRARVIEDYLSAHDDLTFEEVRDLALNIATTDSFGGASNSGGGNPWTFVADDFKAAVAANSTPDRDAAIAMLDAWDGHVVAGGPAEWRFGTLKADAWVMMDAWITEVMRLTFEDEFMSVGMVWDEENPVSVSFNVLLRALAGGNAALPTLYDWFQDKLGTGKPTTAEGIIVLALDNTIDSIGLGPYNVPRGYDNYGHALLGALDPAFNAIHRTPKAARSAYAHVVEYGENGPVRIESMFQLGQSGAMYYNGTLTPTFDPNNFSMAPFYDTWTPRVFPLFP